MIDDYPDTYASISVHVGSDGYDIPWGNSRGDFYGANLIPWLAYDGLEDAWPISTYESKFITRQAVPTDVTIALNGVRTTVAATYDVTADVCVEAGGTTKDMRIYMVQVLDHYPTTAAYYRNCLMQGATTEDLNIAAGACTQVTRTFTLDAVSLANEEDVKVFAWAQEQLDAYPAEIFQAAKLFLGPIIPVFADGFEGGTLDGWSAVTQ